MQTANCWIKTDKFNEVFKKDVTPAEAQHLIKQFQDSVGTIPVHKLEMQKDVERSSAAEKNRLLQHYREKHKGVLVVESMFPGATPSLPTRFDEVVDKQGNKVFSTEGQSLTDEPKIIVGGKAFRKEDIEKMLAAQIKPVDSIPATGELDTL